MSGRSAGAGAGAPALSVIVPTFNSEATMDVTVASVLSQTRGDLELIVVDDGSADRSHERARAWAAVDPRVRAIRQDNTGVAGARIAGIAIARGGHLALLDADDVWMAAYAEATLAVLEGEPGAGLAFSDGWLYDEPSGLVHRRGAVRHYRRPVPALPDRVAPQEALARLLRLNFITTASATFTRGALERAGGLDPAMDTGDDWDLWVRIAAAGCEVLRVDQRLVVYRSRPDSQSADRTRMSRSARLVLAKALRSGLTPTAERIAAAHLRTIEGEIGAEAAGDDLRRRWWWARRRLARRPSLRRGTARLRPTPEEVSSRLDPALPSELPPNPAG